VSKIENQRFSLRPDFGAVPAAYMTRPVSAIFQSRHSRQWLRRMSGRLAPLAGLRKGQRPCVEKSAGGSVAVSYQTFCSRETALPKDRRYALYLLARAQVNTTNGLLAKNPDSTQIPLHRAHEKRKVVIMPVPANDGPRK
jgi:hypothetical protein